MDWQQIRKEWETSDISFKGLAERHGISDSTIRSRKNREKWQRNATKKKATQRNDVATKQKSVAQKKSDEIKHSDLSSDLTDKQRLFCIYYLKYFNATKSYRKAYGCDYTTAMVNGSKLLRNAKVSHEIDRLREERTNELQLQLNDVIQKYIDIAFADITDFVEFGHREEPTGLGDGPEVTVSYVNLNDYDQVDGTIITEVKQGRDGVTIKLADRMKALEALEKYVGFMNEEQKARIAVLKTKVPNQNTQDINSQINALADLINNPVPERVIDDD